MVTEVSKLKQELDGDIVVYASYQLGRTLIEHDLVDELRLIVFPVVLGAGERLFGETSDKKPMRLVDTGRSVTASCSSPTSSSETPRTLRQQRALDAPALPLGGQLDADYVVGHALAETATREHAHQSTDHPGIGSFVTEGLRVEAS